jgi:ligand-binding sensor domain-containing protein
LSFFHDSFYNLRRVEYPECRDIDVFCEDKYGNIWIGTDGNGLFLLDKSKGSKLVKQAIPNNAIVSLLAAVMAISG